MQKRKLFNILARSIFIRSLPDKIYLLFFYRRKMGKRLDLQNPRTFTEKIQWLKLYWRNPLLTLCTDKYESRKFVSERVGPALLKNLYGVYEKPEDIDIRDLPESFVLKVNHACKRNIFCQKKSELNWKGTVRILNKYLKENYYYYFREWAYKDISPRIICEEHLAKNDETFYEYGFYCYDGVARFVEINEYTGRSHRVNMFDLDLNLLDNKYGSPPLLNPFIKPPQFEKMLEYSTILSNGFPFVRVDLQYINNKIYFGELTFYPLAGLCKIDPESFDYFLGSYLQLPVLPQKNCTILLDKVGD